MSFDDLPKEKQEALIMLGHRLEIEAEDDKRRQCTRFGYRFGGSAGLAAAVGGMVVLSGILVIALAFIVIVFVVVGLLSGVGVWVEGVVVGWLT